MLDKNDVLRALMEAGDGVSGAAIAKKLNVSRNAVWKAVEALREDGHEIEGGTNRGYRLAAEGNVITKPGVDRWRRTEAIAAQAEIHDCIGSTNSRAKDLARDGAAHGFLVAADRQDSGRGRFGRQFFSPEGAGIYISFVLRPKIPAEKAVMITSMAAVAVARAIESLCDAEVKIKWVNDLYINDRKVCGILSEASVDFESGCMEYVVLGIGVNVGKVDFPEELAGIATSIFNETGAIVNRNRLIAEIANRLEGLWDGLEDGAFMDEYRKRSNVIGRCVTVLRGSERFEAEAVDIDDQGRLVVRTESGTEHVGSGEISLKLKGVHY